MKISKTGIAKIILASMILFVVFPVAYLPAGAAQKQCNVAIVKSWNIPQYNTGLEGFYDVMNDAKVECKTAVYSLDGEAPDAGQLIQKIRTFKPDVILTVGSRDTSIVSENIKDVPIVFSMVLYPVASEFVPNLKSPGRNLTGAAIDIPIERQLRTLLRMLPKLKRVGVLYSPGETLPVVEEAKRVAASINLVLFAEQVNSESDVPHALDRLDKYKMDALWSVADGRIFTGPSTQYIGEYVLRRGIPFMGPGNEFLKAGAVVALDADYMDCGRQAGEITLRILNGAEPEHIPVATARTVKMGLNLQTARHIGVTVPPSMIEDAWIVIE